MLGQLANVVAAAASNAEVPLQQLLQLQPQQGSSGAGGMRWVAHHPSFVGGEQPDLARSGHTAAVVGSNRSLLVVFGGLRDKTFLGDCVVLDMAKRVWMSSAAVAASTEGPGPRAFHCAAVTDSGNMFVFGRRAGKHRLADFWMLDVETWQWVELPCSGAVPPPRDFASLVAYGRFLILHGGWDGSKFLSDTYVLDTSTLEWRQVLVSGAQPAARCGHAAIIVEKRMLLFGGRGQGGSMQNDLWALKDFLSQDQLQKQDGTSSSSSSSAAAATWTQLRLQGTAPSARCGHCVVSGRTQVMVHGGHSQGGWLSRVDTYLNDIVVLDRSTASWRGLPVAGETIPPPRAYHTLTRIVTEQQQHVRYLCIGGYDGSHTLTDLWWLLPSDDPWARRDAEMEARRKVLSQAAATVTATAALVPPAPPPTTVNRQHLPPVGAKAAAAQAFAGASEGLPSLAASELEGQEWQQQDTKASMEGLRQRLGLASGPSASRATGTTQWGVSGDGDGSDDGADGSTLRLHELGVRLLRIQRAFDAPSASGSGEGEGDGGVQRDGGDADRQIDKGREPAAAAIAVARRHLATTDPTSLCMMEVRLLFNDYRSQVAVAHLRQSDVLRATEPASAAKDAAQWRFFHLRSGHEVRMADVAPLQSEYKQLLLLNGEPLRATGA